MASKKNKIILKYAPDGSTPEARREPNRGIKKRLAHISVLIGLTVLVASYLTVIATFAFAYFSEEKRVIVDINTMGEAKIEALIFIVTSPFVAFTTYYLIKKAFAR